MSVLDQGFRTVKCDNPGCDKSITFEHTQVVATLQDPANAWTKSVRIVKLLFGGEQAPTFSYCSDVCEIEGIKTGKHNPPEQKKIIEAANPAAVMAAARAAELAKSSDANLKSGRGGPVLVQG